MDEFKEIENLQIIKSPVITEKSYRLLEERQYTFDVDPRANKQQIKKAIESLFSVKVDAVNTYHKPKKKRRVAKFVGNRVHYKRAIVTLNSNSSITLFSDN
uniref:Large ribosomal subunit protein uL23c n=1 Tax=Glaucocystis sp. BBH TaxID=2023628 RepID=A0A3G1IV33_9EUKA|nr:ribosomal protein L23 [Glaucocystis sp. BBH]